tara:strand:+ start:4427 stop:4984 length:558 start_codon:yes stop_codon:yes gene_type:complete
MKYLQLPCNWFEQANVRNAIRRDEAFGFQVLGNLILKVGSEFNFGDWIRSGFDFDLVPFGYEMTNKDWYRKCMIKDSQHNQFWELLTELKKFDVLDYKRTEYSMWLCIWQLSSMTDESNRKACKSLFGKGRLSLDEIKEISKNKHVYSGKSQEQIRQIYTNKYTSNYSPKSNFKKKYKNRNFLAG